MQRRIEVGEEVPHVADQHAHDLILRDGAVEGQAEAHQDPGQVGRREDEQAEEAQASVWVAPRPDVDERRRERVAEEGHRHKRRHHDQARHRVEKQPREVRR